MSSDQLVSGGEEPPSLFTVSGGLSRLFGPSFPKNRHFYALRCLCCWRAVNHSFCLVLKVEGCPGGGSAVTPRKRLHSAEEARCSSRPPPEGAGSISESEEEKGGGGGGGSCQQCQKKVSELKKQALALADQNSLKVVFPFQTPTVLDFIIRNFIALFQVL